MASGVTRATARAVERGISATRARFSHVLDTLQLRLRAIDVSRDPEVKQWVAEMRDRVRKGEVERMLAEQPDDPRVFVERFRRTATS